MLNKKNANNMNFSLNTKTNTKLNKNLYKELKSTPKTSNQTLKLNKKSTHINYKTTNHTQPIQHQITTKYLQKIPIKYHTKNLQNHYQINSLYNPYITKNFDNHHSNNISNSGNPQIFNKNKNPTQVISNTDIKPSVNTTKFTNLLQSNNESNNELNHQLHSSEQKLNQKSYNIYNTPHVDNKYHNSKHKSNHQLSHKSHDQFDSTLNTTNNIKSNSEYNNSNLYNASQGLSQNSSQNSLQELSQNSNSLYKSLENVIENTKKLDRETGQLLSHEEIHSTLFPDITQAQSHYSSSQLFANIPTYTTNQESISFIFSNTHIPKEHSTSLDPDNLIGKQDNIAHKFKKIVIPMQTAQANVTIDDNFETSNPSKILNFVHSTNREILFTQSIKKILHGNNDFEPEGLLTHAKSSNFNTAKIQLEHLYQMISVIRTKTNSQLYWIMHPKTFIILQSLQFKKNYFSPIIREYKLLDIKIILVNEMSNIYEKFPENKQSTKCIIALADLKNAYKIIKGPNRIKKIDTPYHSTYCTFQRFGGKIIDPHAIIKLNLEKTYDSKNITQDEDRN